MTFSHDSVHGPICWFDSGSDHEFATIVRSKPLRRLKQISQLGFASESFPMATHDRFSHALGSMRVAVELAGKLSDDQIESCLSKYLDAPDIPVKGGNEEKRKWVTKYIALSALLQDIGELPFESATRTYFELNGRHRQQVASWLGCNPSKLSGKKSFTLACLNYISESLKGSSIDFVIIARMIAPGVFDDEFNNPFINLILDSPFDADRIDYVLRDSVPTIGGSINSSQIIASIKCYRDSQIVINSAAPIAASLLARNVLYRAVYLDAKKRLCEASLRSLITSIQREAVDVSYNLPFGEIAVSDFLSLTDNTFIAWSKNIYEDSSQPSEVRRLAGTVLGINDQDYEAVWLSRDEDCRELIDLSDTGVLVAPSIEAERALDVPDQFFVVDGSDTKTTLKAIVPELFSATLDEQRGAILAYIPRSLGSYRRSKIESARNSGALYNALSIALAEQSFGSSTDTRNAPDFGGIPIHISWCWDDIVYVRMVIRALHRKKQKYRILLSDFDGLGSTPRQNSIDLIKQAPAVLVIASKAYIERWKKLPNGNLAAELLEINNRVRNADGIKILPIAIENWRDIEDFPWSMLGFENSTPFLGKPLSECRSSDIEELADIIIQTTQG